MVLMGISGPCGLLRAVTAGRSPGPNEHLGARAEAGSAKTSAAKAMSVRIPAVSPPVSLLSNTFIKLGSPHPLMVHRRVVISSMRPRANLVIDLPLLDDFALDAQDPLTRHAAGTSWGS